MSDCIFCQIVRAEAPSHIVWEDDHYLAFLSIFPNTAGFTVVITKDHHDSDVTRLPEDVFSGLMLAARTVCHRLDAAFPDVGRTGIIAEGFGVNHAHVKLFPMHGTAPAGEWEKRESDIDTFFDTYRGYISSHNSERADDAVLAKLAEHIRRS